jgi:hypothetical protein
MTRGGSPLKQVADAAGALAADRPFSPSDPVIGCGDDGRITTATFIAYAKGAEVARLVQRADNARRGFSARLAAPSSPGPIVPIDLVTAQVCRQLLVPVPRILPPDICGLLQEYRAPFPSSRPPDRSLPTSDS